MEILQWIESWDVSVLQWIQENLRNDVLDPVMLFITNLGSVGFIWIVVSLILMIPKRTRMAGLVSAISMAVSFLAANLVIKPAVARLRPYETYAFLQALQVQREFSFPSGHTVCAFASSLILVRMLPKKAGIPLVILAIAIAWSRLYVGVHYPSDVIAGFLFAAVMSQIVWSIYTRIVRRRREKEEAGRESFRS